MFNVAKCEYLPSGFFEGKPVLSFSIMLKCWEASIDKTPWNFYKPEY
jgi:hypothetical protein